MSRFACINLKPHFNASGRLGADASRGGWNPQIEPLCRHMPRGKTTCWGIPFRLGPKNLKKDGLLVLRRKGDSVRIPVEGRATHICFLHFCDVPEDAGVDAMMSSHVVPPLRESSIRTFATPL